LDGGTVARPTVSGPSTSHRFGGDRPGAETYAPITLRTTKAYAAAVLDTIRFALSAPVTGRILARMG